MRKIDRREFLIAGTATAGLTAVARPLQACTPRMRVTGLTVDYVDKPLGLENPRPQLSWRLDSPERNVRQSAYRILVASEEAMLGAGRGDLWDSGKVTSRNSLAIEYQGAALLSRQRCWWRVQVWDEKGAASDWSASTWWEMGLLSPQDWSAQWLAIDDALSKADRETPLQWMWGAAEGDETTRQFRSTFNLPAKSHSGVLFICGRTYGPSWPYEKVKGIWLDGAPLGGAIPERDLARERIALPALSAGEHCLAFEVDASTPLAETFIGSTQLFGVSLLARFDRDQGASIRILSGPDWKTSVTQDAAWHQPHYNDSVWPAVAAVPLERPITIDPVMHLRRPFSLEGAIVSARLYLSALGCCVARLNGQRIGDALLSPEVSQYDKRVLYRVYDVGSLVQSGSNVLGLTVGDGWYGSHPGRYGWGPPPRRAMAQLEIEFADGSRQTLITDRQWRLARGPLLQSELCVGELYDARLEQDHWDTTGFDDSHWEAAQLAPSSPGRLQAQCSPPIRAMQTLKPITITSPVPGVYVFDFGQNFAGGCRLHVTGAAGTRIDLLFGEELKPSGEIDQFVLLGGKARDTYILRGTGRQETFEPTFAYHGFRYVQVMGFPGAPSQDTVEGIIIHSDLPLTGQLRVDNALIDRIWRNSLWSQRSNFVGIPTDCANRAERAGWMGDAGVFWDAAAFNMDIAAFTRRQMDNVRDAQRENGAFPMVAPGKIDLVGADKPTAAAGWADGGVILPWTNWWRYGDLGIIEQNWAAMRRYLQFIEDHNPNGLWQKGRGLDFGDWLAIGNNHFYHPEKPPTTPIDLIATAYWAHSADLLAQMAQASGRSAEAQRLRAVRERVREAFIAAFVQKEGRIGNGSQTSYILALQFGLVPDALRQAAAQHLVAEIQSRGIALSTGILGSQFALDVLTDAGYPGVAYSLLLRTEDPSWGYMIDKGATTMWEMWDGDLDHRHNEGSHNHYMRGSVSGFLFRRIAGIDAAEPGFRKIRVRPVLDPRVKRGGGDYDSVVGRITTRWEQRHDRFTLNVTVPANTTAHIHLPARHGSRIMEGRTKVSKRRDMRILDRRDTEVMIQIGSGSYQFVVLLSR